MSLRLRFLCLACGQREPQRSALNARAIMLADDSRCWMGLSWLQAGARRDVGVHRDLRSLVRKAFLLRHHASSPCQIGRNKHRTHIKVLNRIPTQSQLSSAKETYAKRGKCGSHPRTRRDRGAALSKVHPLGGGSFS